MSARLLSAMLAVGVWAAPASLLHAQEQKPVLQALSASDAELRLDEEMKRQHERRVQAYEQLKGRLDTSLNTSAEARNLAVGSALQMVTPLTEIKVQQLQQQQMYR